MKADDIALGFLGVRRSAEPGFARLKAAAGQEREG
jgi:hypothetical protein